MPPDAERPTPEKGSAVRNALAGVDVSSDYTTSSTDSQMFCPAACSPSCSFRCPIAVTNSAAALLADVEPLHLVADPQALVLARRHQTVLTALCGHQATPRTVATVRALIAADNICTTCRERFRLGGAT